jgi:1-acyl-sn-glycerol-3-phosphate acyltransferase
MAPGPGSVEAIALDTQCPATQAETVKRRKIDLPGMPGLGMARTTAWERADEVRLARPARRLVTVSGYALAWLLLVTLLPAWLGAALVVDAMRRRRWIATRLLLFGVFFLSCELLGLATAGLLWTGRLLGRWTSERWLAAHYRLQTLWASALFTAARRLFGLRVVVEDGHLASRGPLLVLMRHASIADTLLPAALLQRGRGLRLRYVLKRELLVDPCLDVVGLRLPNVFVRRDSGESGREIALVRRLAEDLGPSDAVLIYPEGTRFSEGKRARAIEKLAGSSTPELAERARELRHVLPPRLGGPLALLDAAKDVDVLLLGHVGFDGLATLRDIWSGALVGRAVRVRFWRVPAAEIPAQREARVEWLYVQWARVDAWIADLRGREGSLA